MELERRQSGLIVPQEKPAKKSRNLGALELTFDENREIVKSALGKIVGCLNKERIFAYRDAEKIRRQLFDTLADALLGPDAGWEETC